MNIPFAKDAIQKTGKKYQYGHDRTGRMIKITMVDEKEVSREFLNARITWPGGTSVPPENATERANMGVANLGIKKFKRDNPNATGADIRAYKEGAWAFPIAQMNIEMSALDAPKAKARKK